MTNKTSKFSGILAQARHRDTEARDTEARDTEARDTEARDSEQDNPQPHQPQSKAQDAATQDIAFKPKAGTEALTDQNPSQSATSPKKREITPSTAASKGRPRGKRSDPNFTQITAYISKNTHQSIKIALLNEGQKREISELIEEQLLQWLQKQGQ